MHDGRSAADFGRGFLEPVVKPVVGADTFEKAHTDFSDPAWNHPLVAQTVLILTLFATLGVGLTVPLFLVESIPLWLAAPGSFVGVFLVDYAMLLALAVLD